MVPEYGAASGQGPPVGSGGPYRAGAGPSAQPGRMNRDERTVFSVGAFAVAVGAIFLAVFAIFIVDDEARSTSGGGAGAGDRGTGRDQRRAQRVHDRSGHDRRAIDRRRGSPISNTGTMAHNFQIPQLGRRSGDIQPGGSATMRRHGRQDRHLRRAVHDRRPRRLGHEGRRQHRGRPPTAGPAPAASAAGTTGPADDGSSTRWTG